MSARPLSNNRKSEMPNFRMTKGELATLGMKASIEGVGMSELFRRAIEAYVPKQRTETCVECDRTMVPCKTEDERPLDIAGIKHTLVVTNIPAMECECGEITTDLGVMCAIEELVDKLVLNAINRKVRKEIPQRITLEELFGEKYLED